MHQHHQCVSFLVVLCHHRITISMMHAYSANDAPVCIIYISWMCNHFNLIAGSCYCEKIGTFSKSMWLLNVFLSWILSNSNPFLQRKACSSKNCSLYSLSGFSRCKFWWSMWSASHAFSGPPCPASVYNLSVTTATAARMKHSLDGRTFQHKDPEAQGTPQQLEYKLFHRYH